MEKDLKLLCEIGFAGVRRGVKGDPAPIFETLSALRPDNACGAIGLSLLEANRGAFDAAIEILETAENTCTEAVTEAREIRRMITQVAAGREASA